MDIFSIFTLLGGLAFFLHGMSSMSQSLEKMAGSKLELILRRMTENRFKALALGVGITVAIQSSSAVTVMLVGLVNSNVMTLQSSIGVILGTNIGTTVTAWILSLTGISSSNVFVQMLKPKNFSPLLAFIGVILIMTSKHQRRRDIGRTMVGFAVLMYGMQMMEGALSPLAENEAFTSMMVTFENPILGILFGAGFTALIQSSSASVGILQALALSGIVPGAVAVPIILGQNIGTCITALLSSIGVSPNARRVAVVHISFNLIGSTIFMVIFYSIHAVYPLAFMNEAISVTGIALCHSIFNILTTLMLLPFTSKLEWIANKVISERETSHGVAFLDSRLLNTPGVAVTECVSVGHEMADLTHKCVRSAMNQIWEYNEAAAKQVLADEDTIDVYEDRLGSFLVEITRHNISSQDSRNVTRLLHCIGDFERLSDHAANLVQTGQELRDKQLVFSTQAEDDLQVLFGALDEILIATISSFKTLDRGTAMEVEPLEETIDELIEQIRLRHIQRLQDGSCTIQMGMVLSDLLTDCERIGDHCSNVALRVLESIATSGESFSHNHDLHKGEAFQTAYELNMQKYQLQ
ncbi:Na/Pi cotransporter family protein [Bengtsoniella intestinalis]|uniref:Na/Pi cotransporter family protein n=1 Tax=Bengtsoniella intestinalis TaxID=3073143 RepID=UPI00391F7B84